MLTMELQTLFIESSCDDERIIEENVRSVKISSPDVRSMRLFFPVTQMRTNLIPLVRGMVF